MKNTNILILTIVKYIVIIGAFVIGSQVNAQTYLYERNDGFLRVRTEKDEKVSFGFQNEKYKYASDIGLFYLTNLESSALFEHLYNTMSGTITKDEELNIFGVETIIFKDYPNYVTIWDKDLKRFSLSKDEVKKILDKLNEL
jgi:hypothetical protein